jgi:hypothetical protein
MSLGKRIGTLPPRAILAIGYALFLLWAFPGYMSNDSVTQLQEARSGHFSDGNPPLMAAEWFVLDRIISGPVLMLLLQSTLFLVGLYVLLKHVMSERAAAWAAIGILLFPPVLTPMAVIWKDSQMAAYLMAGAAALIQPSRRWRVAGVLLIGAACVMRHNALAAGAPLIGILFEWRNPIRWYKRVGLIAAAAVLALGALFGVNRLLAQRHVRLSPVFYDDLGMIAYSDDMTDEQARELLRGVPLAVHDHIQDNARRIFALRGVYRAVSGDDRMFDGPHNDQEWDAFYRAWRALFAHDPGSYFASHWAVFRLVLGISEIPRAPVYNLFIEQPDEIPAIEHAAWPSMSQQYIGRGLYWLADYTPLYRPWFFAVMALILIPLACRDRLTLALFTSGLLYELSFLPPFAEPDSRYSHWMITAITIATVILFVQRRRRASAAS